MPLRAFDPDHATEYEYKTMKSKGGFVGIIGNKPTLEKFFIIEPTLNRWYTSAKNMQGLKVQHHTNSIMK